MSENVAEARPRFPISKPLAAILAVEAAVSLGLTIYNSAQQKPVPVEAASAPREQDIPYETLMDILPEGPCLDALHGDDTISEADAAKACVRAQAKGKIALIDFTESSKVDTNELADSIELTLALLTDGLIQNTVIVKEATPQEKDAFKKGKGPENCVNPNNLNTWGSVQADLNEPEEADFVVAISDSKSCAKGAVGVTHSGKSRHAEIIAGAIPKPSIDNLTKVAAHEVLHDYGLGHSGSYSKNDMYIFNQMQPGEVFDLEAYLRGGKFDPYGEYDQVMGGLDDTPLDQQSLNLVQLEGLQKPEQTIDYNYPPILQSASNTPGTIDYKAASLGTLMTIPLPENIYLSKSDSFNSIVVVPLVQESQQIVYGAELMLANDLTNSTVSLGQIGSDQECNTWDLRYKDLAFNVTFADNKMTAHLTS